MTLNADQRRVDDVHAERTRLGRPPVHSCLTLAPVTGLSVPDTSENGTANLSRTVMRLPNHVSEYLRSFAIYSHDAVRAAPTLPEVDTSWNTGAR